MIAEIYAHPRPFGSSRLLAIVALLVLQTVISAQISQLALFVNQLDTF